MIVAYFDGACEPVNPGGTASYGAVMFVDGQRTWYESRIVGSGEKMSNNVAEYAGFMAILMHLSQIGKKNEKILVRGDSKLVINQMFGDWRVQKGLYVEWARKSKRLLQEFSQVEGKWVPRDQNKVADALSRGALERVGIR